MTLPSEQEYVVAYKLIPEENTNLAKIDIKGDFSYLVNGQTVDIAVKSTDKPIAQIIEEQLAYRQTNTAQDTSSSQLTSELVKSDSNTDLANNSNTDANQEITNIQTPNTMVSYRVQIAAGHKKIVAVPYFSKRKVKEPIDIEMLDGWYKYTIGSFEKYLQARNKRNIVWKQTPIKDAFVTAYNSGQRITVQEALMISNQTWYQ